jgi:radical SAM superfamily enzyme YgiQ (UPF0313 family)
MLGGMMESQDPLLMEKHVELDQGIWTSVKRSPGGHRMATYLREQGYDVEVVDFWPEWSKYELLKFFNQRVREDTLVVGISSMFPIGNMVTWLGDKDRQKVRNMTRTIQYLRSFYPQLKFIGGAQSLNATLQYDLDFYVTGYAEYAVIELFKYFKGEFNTLKIKKQYSNGSTISVIDCQNDYPAFPMPNAAVKYEERDYIQPQEVLTLELARGCKFKCKFCAYPILGVKGDYSRCGDSVREELLENYEKWGVTNYTVSDETINETPAKLAKLANAIKQLPFQPHLAGFIRADLLVNKPDTWQDLWDMGLRSHFYGIETFHQPAGKIVGKGVNTDKLKEGLLKVKAWFKDKEAGRGQYRCNLAIILGLPEETRETFLDGVKWLQTNFPRDSYGISILYLSGPEGIHTMQNPSVFDRTWQEEGIFSEMTDDEVEEYNKQDPIINAYIQNELFSSNRLKWSHDSMNIWEAYKIYDDIMNSDNPLMNASPDVFYYHRFLTVNKYTIEDMYEGGYDDADNDFERLNQTDLDSHHQFIKDYIQKKLTA